MLESGYQKHVIEELEKIFPGCIVLKNDPQQQQGILDLLILWGAHWASLEVKTGARAKIQPNQKYYVERLDDMSFASFIYPEIEEEVLNALQQAFSSPRGTRVSQS
jgi:hypothetical protein